MNKKLQVFVSSTYTDLIEERQAAVQAILDAGHIPAGMELFKAGNRSQLETIVEVQEMGMLRHSCFFVGWVWILLHFQSMVQGSSPTNRIAISRLVLI